MKLSLKEQLAFQFVFNEKRVYQRWYGRFLSFGTDYGRLRRVAGRIPNWFEWCRQWTHEGDLVFDLGEKALQEGKIFKARSMFHQAVACYHIGQHIFFIDEDQKEEGQARARRAYQKALTLYEEGERPMAARIPFGQADIPAYFRKAAGSRRPLIIFVSGMDNIKEAEGHNFGAFFSRAGFNFLTFDGPGQGELWSSKKFDARDYHLAVSAILDWFEQQAYPEVDLKNVGLAGFSLGGYLAPMCAALDSRVSCAVGNCGLMFTGGLKGLQDLNPIWQRGVTYITGSDSLEAARSQFDWDIEDAPSLQVPLLFYHAGRDEVMPTPRLHADKTMRWARGPKTLNYYADAEHCTVDYLDEVFPEIVDWFTLNMGGQRIEGAG